MTKDFGGTSAQWNAISIGSYNTNLTAAKIHFNSEPQAFVTANYSQWAKDFILGAAQAKIVPTSLGDDYTKTISREQICKLLVIEDKLSREVATKTTVLTGYDDFTTVSSWAQDSVAILANNGIMAGTSNTKLSPKNTTTIEQCLVLALGVFNL